MELGTRFVQGGMECPDDRETLILPWWGRISLIVLLDHCLSCPCWSFLSDVFWQIELYSHRSAVIPIHTNINLLPSIYVSPTVSLPPKKVCVGGWMPVSVYDKREWKNSWKPKLGLDVGLWLKYTVNVMDWINISGQLHLQEVREDRRAEPLISLASSGLCRPNLCMQTVTNCVGCHTLKFTSIKWKHEY